jgi:hypothetical protein
MQAYIRFILRNIYLEPSTALPCECRSIAVLEIHPHENLVQYSQAVLVASVYIQESLALGNGAWCKARACVE